MYINNNIYEKNSQQSATYYSDPCYTMKVLYCLKKINSLGLYNFDLYTDYMIDEQLFVLIWQLVRLKHEDSKFTLQHHSLIRQQILVKTKKMLEPLVKQYKCIISI